MSKIRVYELAKELGVEPKQVLAELRKLGESNRSAASTIDEPLARRFRLSYGAIGSSPTPSPPAPERRPPNDPYKPIEPPTKHLVPYREEPRPSAAKAPSAPKPAPPGLSQSVRDAWPEGR